MFAFGGKSVAATNASVAATNARADGDGWRW